MSACGGAQRGEPVTAEGLGTSVTEEARGEGRADAAGSVGITVAEAGRMKEWQQKRREPDKDSVLYKRRMTSREHDRMTTRAVLDTLSPHERQQLVALEAELIAAINRLRAQPSAYVDTLREARTMYQGPVFAVPGYPNVRTKEGLAAIEDAAAMATAAAPTQALARSPGMTAAARGHAVSLDDRGGLVHDSRDGSGPHERLDLYGRVEGMFAENIAAVYADAELMLLDMFIDDGVESRVHRFNLLGEMFTAVGVGCAPHRDYQVVCVINLAERFREDDDLDTWIVAGAN